MNTFIKSLYRNYFKGEIEEFKIEPYTGCFEDYVLIVEYSMQDKGIIGYCYL